MISSINHIVVGTDARVVEMQGRLDGLDARMAEQARLIDDLAASMRELAMLLCERMEALDCGGVAQGLEPAADRTS